LKITSSNIHHNRELWQINEALTMWLYGSVTLWQRDRNRLMIGKTEKWSRVPPGAPAVTAAMCTVGLMLCQLQAAHAQSLVDTQSLQPLASSSSTTSQNSATDGTEPMVTNATAVKATARPETLETLGRVRPLTVEDRVGYGRQNLPEQDLNEVTARPALEPGETSGMRLGSFVLRPSFSQKLQHEETTTGAVTSSRTYLESGLKGSLTSDWSQHELVINGAGTWQKNVAGTGSTKPTINLDGTLRLDVTRDTTATLKAGYNFSRTDANDPNALSNVTVQSGVNTLTGSAAVTRDFGILRGTTALELSRSIYGDATASSGALLSQKDRDQTTALLRARIGYELSPALIPFLEASAGRTRYDQEIDTSGYQRSGYNYGLKGGFEVDLGAKSKGEIALAYKKTDLDDARLSSIDAFGIEGNATWSPLRGTDVTFGLSTTVDPSTQAGVNGSVSWAANAGINHEISSNLLARMTGSATIRDYPDNSLTGDQTIWETAAGLTWGLNRYLDLTADLGYDLTKTKNATDSNTWRAGIGLTLKR
jgi:hypothetical protein